MSDEQDRAPTLYEQLTGRWQIPLLIVAFASLGLAIYSLRPVKAPPTFDELYAQVVELYEADLLPEASRRAEELLLDPERTPEERRRLKGLLAQIIYTHELDNSVHGVTNAESILKRSAESLGEGESFEADAHVMRAHAFEWLRRPEDALREYRQAVEKGVVESWAVRRRIIEILRAVGGANAEQLHALYDEFLEGEGVSDSLRYWATKQKVELYGLEGKPEQAEALLEAQAEYFRRSQQRDAFEFLQALSWYQLERWDEAERLVRTLRDRLVPGDELYPGVTWLMARLMQAQESPEYALGLYEEVLEETTGGPYHTASMLGRAETMAALRMFDASAEAYEKTIQLAGDDPYGSLVDLVLIRESTLAWYRALLAEGLGEQSLAFLTLSNRLVPPANHEMRALYAKRLADLYFSLGRAALEESVDAPRAASSKAEIAARARAYLAQAGEHYLELAKLTSLDGQRSSEAVWQAADAFDAAGERARTAKVLEAFVRERPADPRTPRALFRLGQTYQAAGEYEQAIERYLQTTRAFATTPSAAASLVPMADCYAQLGEDSKAIETLLRIVERKPEDPIGEIVPIAREYRDALFRLGDLYRKVGEYEKSIVRYEEVIKRYENDPRTNRAYFMLAEGYRLSAADIREAIGRKENVAYVDDLRDKYRQRLMKAHRLYSEVIDRFEKRPESQWTRLERLYVKLSHFARADALFDLSQTEFSSDRSMLSEAVEAYDRAAGVYQNDPMAMSAYVQIINGYLRLGDVDKARMMLERARWVLERIDDDAFAAYAPREDRAYWESYWDWLAETPIFSPELRAAAS